MKISRHSRHAHKVGLILAMLCLLLDGCGSAVNWDGRARAEVPELHVVRRGETLYAIAWRYGLNASDIARWNRLGDGSLIYPGQRLRLRGSSGSQRQSTSSGAQSSANVKRPLPPLPADPSPSWIWPTSGGISVSFGHRPGPGTGVLIDGLAGQSVVAAAAGTVVYAGNGLIGYGKLIILKHNESYLSAYGYNAKLLVTEGATIKQGQPIATMGEGPERRARLHFEIRRNGDPVDPHDYLPAR